MRKKGLWAAATAAAIMSVSLSGMPIGVTAADSAAEYYAEEADDYEEVYESDDEIDEYLSDDSYDTSDDYADDYSDDDSEYYEDEAADDEYPEDDPADEYAGDDEETVIDEDTAVDETESFAEDPEAELTEGLTAEEHFAKGDLLIVTDAGIEVLQTAGIEVEAAEEAVSDGRQASYWIAAADSYSFSGIPAGKILTIGSETKTVTVAAQAETSVKLTFADSGAVYAEAVQAADASVELALNVKTESTEEETAVLLGGAAVTADWNTDGSVSVSGAAAVTVDYDLTGEDGEEIYSASVEAAKADASASYRWFREDGISYLVQQ